jgi:hypothetical protein
MSSGGRSSSSGWVADRGSAAGVDLGRGPRDAAPDAPGPATMQEQERKSRVKGIDAVKASITAAKAVARTLRSSLGPKGMDKMLQSPDGDVTISERAPRRDTRARGRSPRHQSTGPRCEPTGAPDPCHSAATTYTSLSERT